MRLILTIAINLLMLNLFAQEAAINQTDTQGRKTGKWVKKHLNGKVKYEGTFENGKPVGEFKRYNEKGKLTSVLLYSLNGSRAAAYLYNITGKPLASGIYVNQQKDSLWKFFDKDGVLFSEEYFKNGLKYGFSKEFYPNGNIHFERNYKNDSIVGIYKEYYPNGQLRSKKTYVNGNPTGVIVIYHNNGVPKIMGRYNAGLKNGTWKFRDRKAKIVKTEEHENGAMVYTSDTLISYWNDSSKIVRTMEWFDKGGRSYFKSYYPTKELEREGFYWKGKKDSTWLYYDRAGEIAIERNFHKGKRQGSWTFKYPNGKVKSEEGWYLDRKEGEYIAYYENGKIKEKGNYLKGNKSGNWEYFDEDGILLETKDFNKD